MIKDFLFGMTRDDYGLFIRNDKDWWRNFYLEGQGMIQVFLFGMTRND